MRVQRQLLEDGQIDRKLCPKYHSVTFLGQKLISKKDSTVRIDAEAGYVAG